ncbi:DUF5412 family protein [Oceanobacillus sp. 1P07AA]|uniref:DUF5412 family protein n=1 Tax=Oceanobacillus sp. 1P07AA TaxID=3132293 RepID=UPI0039A46331
MINGIIFLFILLIAMITTIATASFCVMFFLYLGKKKTFPKKLLLTSIIGLALTVSYVGYRTYLFTLHDLEGEHQDGPMVSPEGTYTANTYYETYGGAAEGVNIWVGITYNEEEKLAKTIYYSEALSDFEIEWKTNDVLLIKNEDANYPSASRSIELDVSKEIYHDAGLACESILMKDEYEYCYEKEEEDWRSKNEE